MYRYREGIRNETIEPPPKTIPIHLTPVFHFDKYSRRHEMGALQFGRRIPTNKLPDWNTGTLSGHAECEGSHQLILPCFKNLL